MIKLYIFLHVLLYRYGYANGDIQFTPGFMKTVSKINQYNAQVNGTDKPIVFISSKRIDVYVSILDHNLKLLKTVSCY